MRFQEISRNALGTATNETRNSPNAAAQPGRRFSSKMLMGQRDFGDFVRPSGVTSGAKSSSGVPAQAGFKHSIRDAFRKFSAPAHRKRCSTRWSSAAKVAFESGAVSLTSSFWKSAESLKGSGPLAGCRRLVQFARVPGDVRGCSGFCLGEKSWLDLAIGFQRFPVRGSSSKESGSFEETLVRRCDAGVREPVQRLRWNVWKLVLCRRRSS